MFNPVVQLEQKIEFLNQELHHCSALKHISAYHLYANIHHEAVFKGHFECYVKDIQYIIDINFVMPGLLSFLYPIALL